MLTYLKLSGKPVQNHSQFQRAGAEEWVCEAGFLIPDMLKSERGSSDPTSNAFPSVRPRQLSPPAIFSAWQPAPDGHKIPQIQTTLESLCEKRICGSRLCSPTTLPRPEGSEQPLPAFVRLRSLRSFVVNPQVHLRPPPSGSSSFHQSGQALSKTASLFIDDGGGAVDTQGPGGPTEPEVSRSTSESRAVPQLRPLGHPRAGCPRRTESRFPAPHPLPAILAAGA